MSSSRHSSPPSSQPSSRRSLRVSQQFAEDNDSGGSGTRGGVAGDVAGDAGDDAARGGELLSLFLCLHPLTHPPSPVATTTALATAVPPTTTNTPTDSTLHTCDCHNRVFANAHTLARHLEQQQQDHAKPHACVHPNCGSRFEYAGQLRAHVASVHEKKREYVCDQPNCDKAYKTSSALGQHKKKSHGIVPTKRVARRSGGASSATTATATTATSTTATTPTTQPATATATTATTTTGATTTTATATTAFTATPAKRQRTTTTQRTTTQRTTTQHTTTAATSSTAQVVDLDEPQPPPPLSPSMFRSSARSAEQQVQENQQRHDHQDDQPMHDHHDDQPPRHGDHAHHQHGDHAEFAAIDRQQQARLVEQLVASATRDTLMVESISRHRDSESTPRTFVSSDKNTLVIELPCLSQEIDIERDLPDEWVLPAIVNEPMNRCGYYAVYFYDVFANMVASAGNPVAVVIDAAWAAFTSVLASNQLRARPRARGGNAVLQLVPSEHTLSAKVSLALAPLSRKLSDRGDFVQQFLAPVYARHVSRALLSTLSSAQAIAEHQVVDLSAGDVLDVWELHERRGQESLGHHWSQGHQQSQHEHNQHANDHASASGPPAPPVVYDDAVFDVVEQDAAHVGNYNQLPNLARDLVAIRDLRAASDCDRTLLLRVSANSGHFCAVHVSKRQGRTLLVIADSYKTAQPMWMEGIVKLLSLK